MHEKVFYKCIRFLSYTVYIVAVSLLVNAWILGNIIKH